MFLNLLLVFLVYLPACLFYVFSVAVAIVYFKRRKAVKKMRSDLEKLQEVLCNEQYKTF